LEEPKLVVDAVNPLKQNLALVREYVGISLVQSP
jgi:hypothetical protein